MLLSTIARSLSQARSIGSSTFSQLITMSRFARGSLNLACCDSRFLCLLESAKLLMALAVNAACNGQWLSCKPDS